MCPRLKEIKSLETCHICALVTPPPPKKKRICGLEAIQEPCLLPFFCQSQRHWWIYPKEWRSIKNYLPLFSFCSCFYLFQTIFLNENNPPRECPSSRFRAPRSLSYRRFFSPPGLSRMLIDCTLREPGGIAECDLVAGIYPRA